MVNLKISISLGGQRSLDTKPKLTLPAREPTIVLGNQSKWLTSLYLYVGYIIYCNIVCSDNYFCNLSIILTSTNTCRYSYKYI